MRYSQPFAPIAPRLAPKSFMMTFKNLGTVSALPTSPTKHSVAASGYSTRMDISTGRFSERCIRQPSTRGFNRVLLDSVAAELALGGQQVPLLVDGELRCP
jgi:hypothetical protein